MNAMTFVGTWLAAYRITRLLVEDAILDRPREWWFRRHPPDDAHASLVRRMGDDGVVYWQQGSIPTRKVSAWGGVFNCFWCCGVYISGATVALLDVFTSVRLPVLWWLAVSSAIGLTARTLDG